jgi:lysylphosphatidylglycerol synthetase-like protein (DUF2156 family)
LTGRGIIYVKDIGRRDAMSFNRKVMIVISSIVIAFLIVSSTLRSFSLIDQSKNYLAIILLVLFALPFLIPIVARKNLKLMSFTNNFILIYMGLMLFLIAVNADVINTYVAWMNTSLFGISIAVIGLGWNMWPKNLKNSDTTQKLGKTEVDDLKEKLDILDEKQQKLEKIIYDNFIKFGEDLKKSKDK